MISIETMKFRTADMIGAEFPWCSGVATAASSPPTASASLCWFAACAWTSPGTGSTSPGPGSSRTTRCTVDELGGGADAVGVVSLFAFIQADGLCTLEADGLITLAETEGVPVHQYADMSVPTSWAPWRRQIHGD